MNKKGILGKVLMIAGGVVVAGLGALGLYKASKKHEEEDETTYYELEATEGADVDEVEETNE